jgi:hypothetical protein
LKKSKPRNKIPGDGVVEKPFIQRLRLLRFARNDTETHFSSLRGAQRRSNLDFFNGPAIILCGTGYTGKTLVDVKAVLFTH